MKATFIKTQGDYLEAEFAVDGMNLIAMDEFGGDRFTKGEIIELELSIGLYHEDESWESMFEGNPSGQKTLEHLGGWRYRAYGIITRIDPEILVDVGLAELEAPIDTKDKRVVGETIAFTINRLNAFEK